MDIDYEKVRLIAHCNPQLAEYLRGIQQNMGGGVSQRVSQPPGNSVTQNAGLHSVCQGAFSSIFLFTYLWNSRLTNVMLVFFSLKDFSKRILPLNRMVVLLCKVVNIN